MSAREELHESESARADFEAHAMYVLEYGPPALDVLIGMAIDDYRNGATTATKAMERIRRAVDSETSAAHLAYMRDWRARRAA